MTCWEELWDSGCSHTHVAKIYYSDRTQSESRRADSSGGQVPGHQAQAFRVLSQCSPEDVHNPPPKMSCDDPRDQGNSLGTQCPGGLAVEAPCAWQAAEVLTSGRKADVEHKPRVFTRTLQAVSHSSRLVRWEPSRNPGSQMSAKGQPCEQAF